MTQQSLLQYWSQLGRCSSYSGHRQDNHDHDHGANHGDGGDKDAAIIMLMMKAEVERTVGEDEKSDGEGCNDYQGDKRMMMRRRKKIIMMLTMIMMVMRRKKKRMRSEKTALTAR